MDQTCQAASQKLLYRKSGEELALLPSVSLPRNGSGIVAYK